MSSPDAQRYVDVLPLFADLTPRERSMLGMVFHPRRLAAGETLCREGDRGHSFYVTAAGVIEVYKELPGDRRERLAEVGPNNILGQVALIDRQPRSATLTAQGNAVVLECSVDDFDRLFGAGTPFAYKLLDTIVVQLSRRVREADRELYELFSNPGETLLKLHEAALAVQRTLQDS